MGFEIPQSLPGTDITIGTGEKKTFRSNAKKEEWRFKYNDLNFYTKKVERKEQLKSNIYIFLKARIGIMK